MTLSILAWSWLRVMVIFKAETRGALQVNLSACFRKTLEKKSLVLIFSKGLCLFRFFQALQRIQITALSTLSGLR
jgi:hypothetical protein